MRTACRSSVPRPRPFARAESRSATRPVGTASTILLAAVVVPYLAGCSADDAPVAPPRTGPASIVLSSSAVTLPAIGDTVRLAAAATDANGDTVAGISFTWESSDLSVATVDSEGVVQAAGKGYAAITAATGSISGTALVTIPGPAPFDATPPPADPTPVAPEIMACRGWEEWFVGDFSYFNNVWNRQDTRDYEQCIMRRTLPGLVETVEYGWRWRWPTRRGQVKAYPELIYGHKPWHPRSTTPELPRRIDAIEALEVDYEAYLTVEGTYNLAFDFWITRDDPPSVSGISHEVMIWLDHDFRPAGQEFYVGPVRIEGVPVGSVPLAGPGLGRMQTGTANSSPTTWRWYGTGICSSAPSTCWPSSAS